LIAFALRKVFAVKRETLLFCCETQKKKIKILLALLALQVARNGLLLCSFLRKRSKEKKQVALLPTDNKQAQASVAA